MACHLRGAPALEEALRRHAAELGGDQVHVGGVSCLGQCDSPPALAINDHCYWGITTSEARSRIAAALEQAAESRPQRADRSPMGWKDRHLRRRAPLRGRPVPGPDVEGGPSIERRRDAVIEALKVSNLRGMGGAGFPTHLKWKAVRDQPGPEKYVVCNADESEPGTFKDRELIRRAPHLLVEGMILAGLVAGASQGYIYVRHEYEEEIEVIDRVDRRRVCRGRLRRPDPRHGPLVRPGGLRQPRRLHLRRGDRAPGGDGGPPGRAPEQAPVPHRGRAPGQGRRSSTTSRPSAGPPGSPPGAASGTATAGPGAPPASGSSRSAAT